MSKEKIYTEIQIVNARETELAKIAISYFSPRLWTCDIDVDDWNIAMMIRDIVICAYGYEEFEFGLNQVLGVDYKFPHKGTSQDYIKASCIVRLKKGKINENMP
jgi:hypothetical protein